MSGQLALKWMGMLWRLTHRHEDKADRRCRSYILDENFLTKWAKKQNGTIRDTIKDETAQAGLQDKADLLGSNGEMGSSNPHSLQQ